jgi:hypothetical protein
MIGSQWEGILSQIEEAIKRMRWINLNEKELKLETNLEWHGFLWR